MQRTYEEVLDSKSKLVKVPDSVPVYETFSDILPDIPIMPDESPMDFAVFQEGLSKDLAPNSPYQHVVSHNIIANEWEMFRLRRWSAVLLANKAADDMIKIAAHGLKERPSLASKLIPLFDT